MTDTMPKAGDHLILDGVDRVIVTVDAGRNKVIFDNPPDVPHYGELKTLEDGSVKREVLNPSRAGTCALGELTPFITIGDTQVWALPGRLEAKRKKEGAATLVPADHNINK